MVDKKFIINLQGKEFIKFEGLLDEFHKNGGKSIDTNIISEKPFIIKAIVKGEKGEFSGMGDASEENVNKLIAKHRIRMAETRAIARALRWYNNIGMCSAEELGGDSHKKEEPKESTGVKLNCVDCGIEISEKVKDYSVRTYNKPLCMDCQKKQGGD